MGKWFPVTKGNHWKDTGEVTDPEGSQESHAQKTDRSQRKLGLRPQLRPGHIDSLAQLPSGCRSCQPWVLAVAGTGKAISELSVSLLWLTEQALNWRAGGGVLV